MAGKGGTGKTTLSALIIRCIKEKKLGSVLAIDADPNSNLGEALGVRDGENIGRILDSICSNPDKVPAGMAKERFIQHQVQSAIQEEEGFDILSMGKPEGPGCYCYVNNVLRNVMSRLIKDYAYIIIDNEAGLEHLSRRTTRACDALVVVSGATQAGLRAAGRIIALTRELDIKTKKELLLINCSDKDIAGEKIKDLKLDYLGFIPQDKEVEKAGLDGKSLMGLKEEAVSLSALRKIGEKIWLRS